MIALQKSFFEIRMQIQELEEETKRKAELIIRSNRDYMADNFYTTSKWKNLCTCKEGI